jgi:osmotically-inducible protein OsmY
MVVRKALGMMAVATVCGLLAAGCDTPRGGTGDRTGGQVKDDKKLSSEVKRELRNDSVFKYPGVTVQTYNGVAQLSGFVDTEAQKKRAEELATRVPGLTEVENHIVLKDYQELRNAEGSATQPRRVPAPRATTNSTTNVLDDVE